ncbi:hypothetical protein ACS0TY_029020 [Phlomoides rotata]
MGKKVFTSTKHGALETPRNNFELPVDTSYGSYAGRDSKLYSCHSINESSEKNCYSIEAPMKKLISEEISKRSNTRTNVPSIVARLMGVDMLPVDLGQAPLMAGKRNETPAEKLSDKERPKKGSAGRDLYMENSSPQWDIGTLDDYSDSYSERCSSLMKLRKPKPREHPQEEQLQKFKKEFEAWQAARFNECSKVAEFSNAPNQLMAQDELKETSSFYANSRRMKTGDNLMESHTKKKDYMLDGVKESLYSNRRSRADIQPPTLMSADQKLEAVAAPTKIVILRPGPDQLGVSEDSWSSSPSTVNERGSILDFLEEVKERLKSELQGTSSKMSTTFRGGGIETPYREKPSEPRQIAQRIAQQVRDSVTRDIGMNLLRSESTRSYRSDNGTYSPEFINKDTRKLLTERLKNVQKGKMCKDVPTVSHQRLRSSVMDHEKSKDIERQSRPFRQDPDDDRVRYKEPSPGNLVRSLSAPVSGTSFGKLLLEDPHILTGAQIRMKHEVFENVIKRQKKDKFNIREKVSSFGYSLTLRGRLFRRRVQSVDELHFDRDDLFNDIASGPTVMMSSYETHENSTEVPPSPASVCGSDCDELWKPAAFTSPTSSGVNQQEDDEIPDAFSQINLNLNDLQTQLNQLECTEPKIEEQPPEDIDDPTKAYIRDLLVASGYYDGSCNRSLSKCNPLGKPISNQVFDEVEESYRQSAKDHENCKKDVEAGLNQRMLLLDLLNEALPTLLKHPENLYRSVHKPLLQGRELLSRIWEIVVHPEDDRSYYALDRMLEQDLKSDSRSGLMDDEIDALGKDLECHIIGYLIEEMIKDMHLFG